MKKILAPKNRCTMSSTRFQSNSPPNRSNPPRALSTRLQPPPPLTTSPPPTTPTIAAPSPPPNHPTAAYHWRCRPNHLTTASPGTQLTGTATGADRPRRRATPPSSGASLPSRKQICLMSTLSLGSAASSTSLPQTRPFDSGEDVNGSEEQQDYMGGCRWWSSCLSLMHYDVVHNLGKKVDKGSESDMDDSLEDAMAVGVMKEKRAKVFKCSLSRAYQNTQFDGGLEAIQAAGGLEDLQSWWVDNVIGLVC